MPLPKPITASDCSSYIPKTYILGNLIQAKEICLYVGEEKGGKTYTGMNLGLSMAARINWMGMQTMKDLPADKTVLWYNGDMDRDKAKRRMYECMHGLCESFDVRDPHIFDNFVMIDDKYLHEECGCNDTLEFFSDANDARVILKQFVEEYNVGVIFIDTFVCIEGAGQENDANDMSKVMRNLQKFRDETGAAFIIIHHTGKDGEGKGRGSSAIFAGSDNNLKLVKTDAEYIVKLITTGVRDTAGNAIGIRHEWKQRIDDNGNPMVDDNGNPIQVYRCYPDDLDGVTTKKDNKKTQKKETSHSVIKNNIMALLSDGNHRAQKRINDELKDSGKKYMSDWYTGKNILEELVNSGDIEVDSYGCYYIQQK